MEERSGIETEIETSATKLEGLAEAIDRSVLDERTVKRALGGVRLLQRRAEAIIACLATQSQRIAANGGPAAEDALTRNNAVPLRQARTELRRATLLQQFPAVAAGFRSGDVSSANIDVLAGVTGRMTTDEIAALIADDDEIARSAARLGDDSFRRKITRKRDQQRKDGGKDAARQALDDSTTSIAAARDNTGYDIHGFLDPIRGASVKAAMEREARLVLQAPTHDGMTREQAMAQALHDLVLRGDATNPLELSEKGRTRLGATRANVNINVLVDRQTLEHGPHRETTCETESGLPLSPGDMGRLCCDATLRRIDTAPDGSVHVSRKTRTATAEQRAALRVLYPSCPLSGEGWDRIEVHHVIFYEQSQRTVLSELVPISRRWHHLVHDAGWRLDMDSDRTLHLYRPDGTHDRTIQPPTPVNQLRSKHDERRLDLAA